jgi:proteasome lid subunit RPN8/RPN11
MSRAARTHAWKWIWTDLDLTLWVQSSVAFDLCRHRQSFWQRERGGQLFASTCSDVGLELALATPPDKRDRSGRAWLELDTVRCREEIDQANADGLRLVGYWHTHPESSPELSSQDLRSFKNFVDNNEQLLPNVLAVIVGTSNSLNGIRAWTIRPGSIHLAQCVAVFDPEGASV